MDIKHVLISVNSNKEYLDYWPICSKCWKEGIGIEPTLVVVDSNPNSIQVSDAYGKIIRCKSTPKYSVFLNAAIARIWGMLQYPKEISIVGDIDLLPLNKEMWKLNLDPNAFTWIYNPRYLVDNRHFICYFACTGEKLAEIFDVDVKCSLEELIDKFIDFGTIPWNRHRRLTRIKESMYGMDEVALTDRVDVLEREGKLKVDNITKNPLNRMWRGNTFPTRFNQWERGVKMLDMHCHRPWHENVDLINYVCNKTFGWDLPVEGEVKPYKNTKLEVI